MNGLYCPICQKKINKTYVVSAEILLAQHVYDHHTNTEIHRALHPCTGCDGKLNDDIPQPFLALVLQDEGPAQWREVDYCLDCVAEVKEGRDVIELVPRKPIYSSEI